jgi:hypothetical protein
MRSLATAAVVLVAACGLSGCGTSSSSTPTVAEANQAATKVNSDLPAYLSVKAPASSTAHAWQEFFSRGDTLVGNLAGTLGRGALCSTVRSKPVRGHTMCP